MNRRLSDVGGRTHGRFCDGVWWVAVAGRVASARSLGEAFERAMRASLN